MQRNATLSTALATVLVVATTGAARSERPALRDASVTFEAEQGAPDSAPPVVIEAAPPVTTRTAALAEAPRGVPPSSGVPAPTVASPPRAVQTDTVRDAETTTTVTTTVTTTILPYAAPVAAPHLRHRLPGVSRSAAAAGFAAAFGRAQQFSVHRAGNSWMFTRAAGGPSFTGSLDLASLHLAPAIASAARAGTVTLYLDGRKMERPHAPPMVIATALEGSAPDHPLGDAP